jgi:hypothetical protein
MARNVRLTVFVDLSELDLLRAVCPPDVSMGAVVRRLALERAEWYAKTGNKKRIDRPVRGGQQADAQDSSPRAESAGGYELDYDPSMDQTRR